MDGADVDASRARCNSGCGKTIFDFDAFPSVSPLVGELSVLPPKFHRLLLLFDWLCFDSHLRRRNAIRRKATTVSVAQYFAMH